MFEETEVCIHCGRPVEGRVYCSAECESLDSASPSISSVASSAYASPCMKPAPGTLDVPALVPSVLGHRARHSISSSSNSSTTWSAVTDEEEADPYLYSDPYPDMLSAEPLKSPGYHAGLFYARRPSTTNHRSTVPTLHRHTPAASSSASSLGMSHGLPSPFYASTEDDASSVCISELSLHDDSTDAAAARRKSKRTSLPAYFSLLQGSSVTTSSATSASSSLAVHTRRGPSALQSISRSLQASPTTPKVAHATVDLTQAIPHFESPSHATMTTAAVRGRGRHRERDTDARSASSRRSTARSPPRQRQLSAAQRARLDSVEKVAEWVSASPIVGGPAPSARRNSSPQRKPRYDLVEALTRGLKGCAIESDGEDDEEEDEERERQREEYERTLRGRRRAEELDEAARQDAPGIGSGRSGLRARERGRAVAARAIGIALR